MKTFHHGGRIGDLMFALYTMKILGGGGLILSDYHKPNWDLEIAQSLESFLLYQDYIESVSYLNYCGGLGTGDYDLQHAEADYNPEAFPEWDRKPWPSNCNILKRYAVHFGVEYPPKGPWLTAPATKDVDIVMHCPQRRSVRSKEDWAGIMVYLLEHGYAIEILDGRDYQPYLESADYINSASVFLGVVSSCNAVAEGLGKTTVVEQAGDCFNVTPTYSINGMSNAEVVRLVRRLCAQKEAA